MLALIGLILIMASCGGNQASRLLGLASAGNLPGIKHKVLEGADPAAVDREDRNLMMRAAYNGHLKVVVYMLALGVNPINHQDKNGWSAVMCAASKGHLEVVKCLLDAGANPDLFTSKGNTALMWAAHGGYSEVVDMLLEAGATPGRRNHLNWTAADIAGRANFQQLQQKLDASINSPR